MCIFVNPVLLVIERIFSSMPIFFIKNRQYMKYIYFIYNITKREKERESMGYVNVINQQNMKTMEAYIANQKDAYNFTTGEMTPEALEEAISDSGVNSLTTILPFYDFEMIGEEVKRPDTPEVQQHDQSKELWMGIYDLLHPEPELDSPVLSSITGGEHARWARERAEFEKQWEEKYRENNPEYSKQMQEYEEQLQAEIRKRNFLM